MTLPPLLDRPAVVELFGDVESRLCVELFMRVRLGLALRGGTEACERYAVAPAGGGDPLFVVARVRVDGALYAEDRRLDRVSGFEWSPDGRH